METYSVRGLKVNNLSMEETLDELNRLVETGGAHLTVTLGVEMVMHAEKDAEFREIVNGASLVVPDSVGILWACKKAGHPLKERVPGIDILQQAASRAERYPWKIFLLGAEPGVAEKAAQSLKEKNPHISIAGCHHGYFTREQEEEVINKIRDSGARVLFAALGFPKQEKWFERHRDKLGDLVVIGVGGSLDVLAGKVKRAPVLFQKLGLEWFYRLVSQPQRIGRMMALPAFVIKIMIEGV